MNIDQKDKHGNTALMYASIKGYKDVVEYLLKNGADVNMKNNKYGFTALMYASIDNPSFNIAKLLIEKGADINLTYGSENETVEDVLGVEISRSSSWKEIEEMGKILDLLVKTRQAKYGIKK